MTVELAHRGGGSMRAVSLRCGEKVGAPSHGRRGLRVLNNFILNF